MKCRTNARKSTEQWKKNSKEGVGQITECIRIEWEKMAMVLNWGARAVQDWQDKAICKENVHMYVLG